MKSKISLLVAVFWLGPLAQAFVIGGEGIGGEPSQPYFPSTPFRYECKAKLEQLIPDKNEVGGSYSILSEQSFLLDSVNRGSLRWFLLNEALWRSYRLPGGDNAKPIPISNSEVRYSLNNRFVSLSFRKRDVGIEANLRAGGGDLGDSWAAADFSSKILGTRADAVFENTSLDLDVDCIRVN